MAGLCDAVQHISDGLENLRTNDKFSCLYLECKDKISELGLEDLKLPRKKRAPRRMSEGSEEHEHASPEEQ